MGGKGGGGGGFVPPDPNTESGAAYWRADINATPKGSAKWNATYGNPAVGKGVYDLLFPEPKPAPAPAPAPVAAAPPPPPPPEPAPVDPGPPAPLGPPIDPGGAIDQPNKADNGLGGDLGGAVLNPPQYWVGGLNNNAMATSQSGRGQGAMKTTE